MAYWSSVCPCDVLGRWFSGSLMNWGPLHQSEFSKSPFAVRPRRDRSREQCFHEASGTILQISCTRLSMYCFHGLSCRIQRRAAVEFTQNSGLILHGSDFNKVLTSLAEISAPSSSNLGIVCCLMGATLIFEESNLTSWIWISVGVEVEVNNNSHTIQLYQARHKVPPHSLMISLQFNILVYLVYSKRLKLKFHCDSERTQKS